MVHIRANLSVLQLSSFGINTYKHSEQNIHDQNARTFVRQTTQRSAHNLYVHPYVTRKHTIKPRLSNTDRNRRAPSRLN